MFNIWKERLFASTVAVAIIVISVLYNTMQKEVVMRT